MGNKTCCYFVAIWFLPMLILIGSFSLLAASTSWRRTSITPSLCLLVSIVSHSDRAEEDLIGRAIKKVDLRKTHCSKSCVVISSTNKQKNCCYSCRLLKACRPPSINTKGPHGRDWVFISVIECAGREWWLPCGSPHRKKLKLAEGTLGMFSFHLKRLHANTSLDWSTLSLHQWHNNRVWRPRLLLIPSHGTSRSLVSLSARLWNTLIHISNGRLRTRHVCKTITICHEQWKKLQVFPWKNQRVSLRSFMIINITEWHIFLWKKWALYVNSGCDHILYLVKCTGTLLVLCHLCLCLWQLDYQTDMYSQKWPETEQRRRQRKKRG